MKLKKPIISRKDLRNSLVLWLSLALLSSAIPVTAMESEDVEVSTVEWESIKEEEPCNYENSIWEPIPEEEIKAHEEQANAELQEAIQENIETVDTANNIISNTYTTVTNKALIFGTKDTVEVTPITLGIPVIQNIITSEYDSPEWEYRKRMKDIVLLNEILVRQLNVAKPKAAAIIANCCFEDTFVALTDSEAHSADINNLSSRLGKGSRGFGIVQWTQKDRQNCLSDYYKDVNNAGYSWEMTSVIAETTCLYNEVMVSGLLGDLTVDDMSLEQATGKMACKFEAYSGWQSDWAISSDGVYHSNNAARYNYAIHILEIMNNNQIEGGIV